jgi:hypothetical protein
MVWVKYVNVIVYEVYVVHYPVVFVKYWNPYLKLKLNETKIVNGT